MRSLFHSRELYRSWLVALRARQKERQYSIMELRLDFICVDMDGDGDGTIEATCRPHSTMQAYLLRVLDRFGAGDADCVVFNLNLEIGFLDSGHFRDDDKIVAFAEHVHRRKSTAAAWA